MIGRTMTLVWTIKDCTHALHSRVPAHVLLVYTRMLHTHDDFELV